MGKEIFQGKREILGEDRKIFGEMVREIFQGKSEKEKDLRGRKRK